jgi:glycosyltransferase involved in cell wall biosynthesis
VSVIVPAFNAAAFIADALDTALMQTYRNLEVIVVDDGSTDKTAEIVAAIASRDSRVRLLRQKNCGVAAARNLAISESRGRLVAPLDADDLWHPDKIEMQVNAMEAGGPRVGLVYAWSSLIDENGGMILRRGQVAFHEGDVFPFLVSYNFIGNGSTPLLRRDHVLEVGGYDTTLRARGGECEDLMLYLRMAERYEVALVPAFLVGYRITSFNLSSNLPRMMRGHELVLEAVRSCRPDLPACIYRWSGALNYAYLCRRSFHLGRPFLAARFFGRALVQDPALLFEPPFRRSLARLTRRRAGRADSSNTAGAGACFVDLPSRPDISDEGETDAFSRRRLAFLTRFVKKGGLVEPMQPRDRIERTSTVLMAPRSEVRNELEALQ